MSARFAIVMPHQPVLAFSEARVPSPSAAFTPELGTGRSQPRRASDEALVAGDVGREWRSPALPAKDQGPHLPGPSDLG
jgi:hypothetical protein